MAKTYIDIVKYMVEASFSISGLVDKPDIIGAVFGQTEGLLGGGLDLRELQKNGKIGRIEIESSASGSRTLGKLFLPSSLGRVETCILGAAIESVDRVGPFETNFKVNKIEDTRSSKRMKIVTRAKDLLKNLMTTEIPDSKEISELVESDVKASVVTTYGPENLPAGPDISSNQDVILVEGRADVINLLKNDIANCIAIGGAIGNIPKSIVELTKSKETTLFCDGDRGGDMIIRGVMNVADVDYIARAPEGKEVEELTRKDIIKSLRSRIPIEQAFPGYKPDRERKAMLAAASNGDPKQEMRHEIRPEPQRQESRMHDRRQERPTMSPTEITNRMTRGSPQSAHPQQSQAAQPRSSLGIADLEHGEPAERGGVESIPSMEPNAAGSPSDQKYITALDELHNTLRGRVYDANGNMMAEIPIRELIQTVQDSSNISTIVFDGIITQRLIELANRQGIKSIYGIRAGQLSRQFENMLLYTKERGKL